MITIAGLFSLFQQQRRPASAWVESRGCIRAQNDPLTFLRYKFSQINTGISMSRNYLKSIICLALLASPISASAALSGEARQNFVDSAVSSCIQKQSTAAENVGLSEKIIAAYCKCNAEYFADNSDIDAVVLSYSETSKGNTPEWMIKMGEKSTAFCLENLAQYLDKD